LSKTHNCQIPGCETVIRVRFLFCHEHWEKLSHSLKDAVNDEYRLWQEVGQEQPTVRYKEVAQAAINHVDKREEAEKA
jgi:hypothetical protein